MAISNTSAAALQVGFQPLIESTERKSPGYEEGIEKINYFILRIHQLITGEMYPTDVCRECGGRIVEKLHKSQDGSVRKVRKCYLIDKQTLDFQTPDEVKLMWKRKFSYGVDSRRQQYGLIKKEFLKEGASYWDPQGVKDSQVEAEKEATRVKSVQKFQEAAQPAPVASIPKPGAPKVAKPPAPVNAVVPAGLEKPAEAKPELLGAYDMDIPEEPEEVDVSVKVWNADENA